MKIIFYPDEEKVQLAMKENNPVFVLVSFDLAEVLVAPADDVVEHNIMLKEMSRSELDVDKYYRVIVNGTGADWTFVCPSNYKGIPDKTRRIEQFYKDGIDAIDLALKKVGYNVEIGIPTRYRRHFQIMADE